MENSACEYKKKKKRKAKRTANLYLSAWRNSSSRNWRNHKKSEKWQAHCPEMIGIMLLAPPASECSGLLLEYVLKIYWAMWQATFPYYSFLFFFLVLPDYNVTHMLPVDRLFSFPKTSLNLTIFKNNERWFLK